MLHEPQSALAKGATELKQLKRWHEIDAARDVLNDVVENPPKIILGNASLAGQRGEASHCYDPTDHRVRMLRAILDAYYEAISLISPIRLSEVGIETGVTEAIDLAIEAAKNAAATEALRRGFEAQGLTRAQVEALMAEHALQVAA